MLDWMYRCREIWPLLFQEMGIESRTDMPRNWLPWNCHATHCILSVCDCCGYTIPGTGHPLPCHHCHGVHLHLGSCDCYSRNMDINCHATGAGIPHLWLLWLTLFQEMDTHCIPQAAFGGVAIVLFQEMGIINQLNLERTPLWPRTVVLVCHHWI